MRAKFINEKFKENSDPIQDLGIGYPIPSHPSFKPMFVLIQDFPHNPYPLGAVFGIYKPWSDNLAAYYNEELKSVQFTDWNIKFFKPWLGEYFKKI